MPTPVAIADTEDYEQRLAETAGWLRDHAGLTAVGVGMAQSGELLGVAVDGERRRGSGVMVTTTDRWHVGSITKSMTATLIARMVEDDELRFDTPLPELLPGMRMHEDWRDCTLHHLLTHTAGLPANFPTASQSVWPDDDDALRDARREFVAALLADPPDAPCGTSFRYSNAGYAVAGHVAEITSGTNYERLLAERLFAPLGLDSAGFGAPRGDGRDDEPVGHRVLFGFRQARSPFDGRADNTPVISAAGRVHMSLEDLVRYGMVHLAGEQGGDGYLPARRWSMLHTPVMEDYGYGWVRQRRYWADADVLWHNGSNTYWYALLLLVPDKDLVLAFVTNDGAIDDAGEAFNVAAGSLVTALEKDGLL